MKQYYVYILSSLSRKLYIGITNNLEKRIWEHKEGIVESFTKRYHINRLVYFEYTNAVYAAIEREKQLKKWRRLKKIKLIETMNPDWKDLYHTHLQ